LQDHVPYLIYGGNKTIHKQVLLPTASRLCLVLLYSFTEHWHACYTWFGGFNFDYLTLLRAIGGMWFHF